MSSESFTERQNDELQVLQAVFMSDYEDLRNKDAWKVARSPEICLTLKPQQSFGNQGGDVYAQLDLVIKCPARYPEVPPGLSIDNAKGLSNQQVADLLSDLQGQAQKLCGQEMLLELSQTIQAFLYAHNKPPPKSFYEEMMCNKKRQEEKQAHEEQKKLEFRRKKEEKEIQIMEGQIQRGQEALKEGTRRRREETRQLSPDDTQPDTHRNYSPIKYGSPTPPTTPHLPRDRQSVSPSPTIVHRQDSGADGKPTRRRRTSTPRCADDDVLPHQCTCKDHTGGTVVLEFNTKVNRRVTRGTCLGHGKNGSMVCVGLETQTGDLVAISEWVLKWRHTARRHLTSTHQAGDSDKEADVYIKQVVSIEQELLSLLRLHHRNLVHYLAIRHQVDPGKITVWLLMEHVGGQNLDIYLTRKHLPLDTLRSYTEELVDALEYLHNKAVVHKNLRASSVFVDHNGRIRLGDYSIDKRLGDLYQTIENAKPGVKFSSDNQAPIIGRGGKKGDVYQLGLLLLSLCQGSPVEELIPTVPTTLNSMLQDFLAKCLLKDDRLRWSTTQLLEHPFLKEPVPGLLAQPQEREPVHNKEEKPGVTPDEDESTSSIITAWEASGQSRLTSEFDVLKLLGKGGFGDVIKVKNKLDGQVYAIKRIPLNPKSQHFNKKITREVKLLSRLNHENVVRYYNSWIETSDENAQSDTSSSSLSVTPKTSDLESKLHVGNQHFGKNSLDLSDDIEKFAPQIPEMSLDFSISYERSRSHGAVEEGESSDSDFEEDENDVFGLSFMRPFDEEEVSDCIVFEHNFDDSDLSSSQADTDKEQKDLAEMSAPLAKLQYLYIQMEYCEKSTLRNCIDAGGLYQDMDRVWRLFREIVEGLLHIHEQGMIHRDLKPVNIFLDSNDHVKIGDFGLATSDIISKGNLKDTALLLTSAGDGTYSLSRSVSLGDGNLTGMVGTALYVSPEMMTGENKVVYSQKVDIYSLGVMFFEMCYRPLDTGMERVKILGQIRLQEINFPEDFDQMELENQAHIIRWLLNHDQNERPTSKELLQSEYIPPPQMEEAELNEVLRATISDPHSKSYRRMLTAMFSQTMSLADDHLYDSHIHKGSFAMKSALTYCLVHDGVVRVFQRHGAIRLVTPLLIPRPKMHESVDQFACFMDHSGRLVCLPFDLRIPFARFVARTNVHHMKRYCIEKVYWEKVFGFHPRELTQCAFDIVTSTPGSLIPDAEVMVVVQDIINEFPPLQQRNYYCRINHTSLLKAILLHAGIPEVKHTDVLTALAEVKRDSRSRMKCLSNLSISEQKASALLNLLETEGPYSKVASILRTVTKTKGPAGTFAKQGLHEIEALISNAENLGLKLPVIVSVGWIYSIQQFSGIIFEVAVDITRKKKTVSDVFAAGGRYDNLIHQFSLPLFSEATPGVRQSGVGVSIAFEKIISAMLDQEDYHPPSAYDVLVCTIGHKPMLKERMALVRDLWSVGIRAEILLEMLEGQEEIQDFCRLLGVSQLVILKDSEGGTVKVRTIEREKITEKVVYTSLLVEFLQASKVSQEQVEANTASASKNMVVMPTNNVPQPASSGSNLSMNFTFLLQEGKLVLHTRRKYEALIVSKVTTCLPWLSMMKCIEVVALDLTVQTLRLIAAFLDVDSTEADFETSIGTIVEKQPRYKKYFSKVTDHIHHLVFEDKCNCIVLYGIKDDSVKLLTSS